MRSVVRSVLRFVCFIVLILGHARSAAAQETVSLAWDPSPDPEVTGYMLSWGTRAGQYPNSVDVGTQTSWVLTGLSQHQRYYFIVQAYDAERTLSEPTTPVDNGGVVVQTGATLKDARPSLFWRHKQSGELLTWHLSGINVLDTRPLTVPANPDTNWKIVGTGDLNGDGHTDLVWRNDLSGVLAAWFLANNWVFSSGYLSIPVAAPGWRVAGVGDTDGDRRADLVWQHTDGSLAVWAMRGLQVLRTTRLSIPRVSDTGWQIAGVGDINNDGRADLVWRHTNGGFLAAWLLTGTTVTESNILSVSRVADPAWRIAAVGPTDGGSPPALIWQHDTGGVAVWYLSTYKVLNTLFLNPTSIYDTNWTIVGGR